MMDDRIAEIREALDYLDRTLGSHVYRRDIQPLAAAARAYADLLDSDALIIRRDENGKWPAWAILAWDRWWLDPTESGVTALFDALASSQGVEP